LQALFQGLDARLVAFLHLPDLLADLRQLGAIGGLHAQRRGEGERDARRKDFAFE